MAARELSAAGATDPRARWLVLVALLGGEGLLLSLLVDLPQEGPAYGLAWGIRVLFPIAVSSIVGFGLAARVQSPRAAGAALPPWRPLPALGLHALAFAATASWAVRLMGPGAAPPAAAPFAAWAGLAALTALLAVASAAPLPWLARHAVARWRAPALALGFGVLVWLGAWLTEYRWGALSRATLQAAAALLSALTGGVVVDAEQQVLGLPGFEVVVAPSCGGTEGIGLVFTFVALWIALARDRIRAGRALLLVPVAVLAAFALNVVRVAALVALGAAGRPEVALGGFHSKLGWFLFTGLALGTVAAAERLPWLRRAAPPATPQALPAPAPASIPGVSRIVPLLAALATALVTGLFSASDVDLLYAARILAALAALVAIRRELPSLRAGSPAVPVLVGLGVGAAWIALAGGRGPVPPALAALAPGWRAAWIAARAAGGVVVIPVVEELAFRGFLLEWIAGPGRDREGAGVPWLALLLSSLAFGALHARPLLGAAAGLVFGGVRLWRGRLGDAVLAHAAANALLAAAAMLGGAWGLWS